MPTDEKWRISELARWRIQGEIRLAHGDWSGALAAMRNAANLDAPAHSREYLGRALVAVATHEHDATRAAELRAEALQAYGVVALHPGVVWANPLKSPPGFYSWQLEEYLTLASQERPSSDNRHAEAELRRLRGTYAEKIKP